MTSIEAFEFSKDKSLFEGAWYVQAANPTVEFQTSFEAAYGKPSSIGSPNLYDCFNLIVWSFENSDDRKDVAQTLENMPTLYGAMGALRMLEGGIVHSEASVRMIKEGKVVTVSG